MLLPTKHHFYSFQLNVILCDEIVTIQDFICCNMLAFSCNLLEAQLELPSKSEYLYLVSAKAYKNKRQEAAKLQ